MINDQSHDNANSGAHPVRHARLKLAVAVAGIAVVLTGMGVGAFVAESAASRSSTQLRDVVVDNVGRPLVPHMQGQPIDDWPWSSQTTTLAN